MDRRDLLKLIATATGTSFICSPAMAVWQEQPALTSVKDSGLDDNTVALITELCETVLPRTDTPGAKDAGLPAFFIGMIRECYTPEQQALMEAGFKDVDARSQEEYGKPFIGLSQKQKTALASKLDSEALAFNRGEDSPWDGKEDGLPHYFTLYKQLMIFGFFTSKTGGTQVLRHVDIPGDYKDIPYKKGDKAWMTVWPV
ncbi:gluconate 2-dehydrogenase subunit 3 family protein [Alteromonas sp. NFXS44]|uniref:gluconate 2-dehydrogenase subunit 3 family protein n=1 Tax=Alteromonas sp. NFXS44 TaxID=2818435 RepID=UPI0032DEB223